MGPDDGGVDHVSDAWVNMGAPGTSVFALEGPGAVATSAPYFRPSPESLINAPYTHSEQHPAVSLYLEVYPGSGQYTLSEVFDWRNITLGMDGGDTTAMITAGLNAENLPSGAGIGTEHLSHLLNLIEPEKRVRIAQRVGSFHEIYFQGYPLVPTIHWTDRGQGVSCLCVCEGQERLRTANGAQVYARRMRVDPLAEWQPDSPDDTPVTALPPVFNAGGLPNRTALPFSFITDAGTYSIYLFTGDNARGADYWCFADALRYLAFFHILWARVPVNASYFLDDTNDLVNIPPTPQSLDPFTRLMSMRVNDGAVASTSVEEAIHQLTDLAGLHYCITTHNVAGSSGFEAEHFLRIFAVPTTESDVRGADNRQMGTPKIYDIPRETPFTSTSGRSARAIAVANRAAKAELTIDRRAINAPIFLGGYREFEVTLLLRPGWLPHSKLDNLATTEEQDSAVLYWSGGVRATGVTVTGQFNPEFSDTEGRVPRSRYHGAHPEHYLRGTWMETGRFWIFPDDQRWTTSEGTSSYERANWPAELYSPFDPNDPAGLVLVRSDIGGDIAEAGPGLPYWVPRQRLFRELISRVQETGDRAPIVRVNFQATEVETALAAEGWVPYGGRIHIDPSRAGLYFAEQNLWASPQLRADPDDPYSMTMLEAYIRGRFMVAVTCVIRGDERMSCRPLPSGGSSTRLRHQVIDQGFERYRYRNRSGQNSHLASTDESEPAFDDRDDTDDFVDDAERQASIMVHDVVSGSLESFYIDPTYRLGDGFSGASGLGIAFGRYPYVVRKEFKKDPEAAGYQTVVHLSDLRHAPEVGAE